MGDEFLPEVALDLWAEAFKECKARRETMAWAVDKLEKLEKLLADDLATVRAVRHALSPDNPRLTPATREEER